MLTRRGGRGARGTADAEVARAAAGGRGTRGRPGRTADAEVTHASRPHHISHPHPRIPAHHRTDRPICGAHATRGHGGRPGRPGRGAGAPGRCGPRAGRLGQTADAEVTQASRPHHFSHPHPQILAHHRSDRPICGARATRGARGPGDGRPTPRSPERRPERGGRPTPRSPERGPGRRAGAARARAEPRAPHPAANATRRPPPRR